MTTNIVIRNNGKDVALGKSFEIELANIPRVNEYILLDYSENDDSFKELYSVLDILNTNIFIVTEIYHNSAISKASPIPVLIFIEAIYEHKWPK